jgi:hypothetical protein
MNQGNPPAIFGNYILPFCIGLLLVVNSFTTLRGYSAGGPAEILLFLALFLLISYKVFSGFDLKYQALLPFLYVILFMAPITLMNSYYEILGSSTRTLVALIFGAMTGFAIANCKIIEKKSLSYGVLFILTIAVLIVLREYDFGTLQRLIFLSNNPNQIALYSLGAMFIFSVTIERPLVLFLSLFIGTIYGYLALSDSFFLALVIALLFAALKFFVQIKSLLFLFIFWSILILIAWPLLLPNNSYIEPLISLWSNADQGGARVTLAINGINAWLTSPLFGHGAGAFSGMAVEFQRFEAHNTIIDFLTMGGIPWILIIYIPIFIYMKKLLQQGNFLALGFLLGFFIFATFHFVGRHPIFWVVWGFCMSGILHVERGKKCVE